MRESKSLRSRMRHLLGDGGFVAALMAAVVLVATPAHANLLTNGSFESGPDPGASITMAAGSAIVPGWIATRAGARYVSTLWTAASGYRSIALNAANAGGIAQTFSSLPHARYNVRFYLAGDPDSQPLLKTMNVTAAHQTGNFTADITGMWAWDPGWNPHNWSFLAESTSTTIEFYSTMSGTTGATLDSVSLELVSLVGVADPAPTALALAAPYPNPAHATSRVAFTLPQSQRVQVAVLDLAGRVVATLADAAMGAGRHELAWDGRIGGRLAPPGLYHIELWAGARRLVRPLVRL